MGAVWAAVEARKHSWAKPREAAVKLSPGLGQGLKERGHAIGPRAWENDGELCGMELSSGVLWGEGRVIWVEGYQTEHQKASVRRNNWGNRPFLLRTSFLWTPDGKSDCQMLPVLWATANAPVL